jgi:hypothetical protein
MRSSRPKLSFPSPSQKAVSYDLDVILVLDAIPGQKACDGCHHGGTVGGDLTYSGCKRHDLPNGEFVAHRRSGWAGLSDFEVDGRRFALTAGLKVEADLLTIIESGEPSLLNGGDMDEDIGATAIGLNKAEAFLGVEPLYGTGGHDVLQRCLTRGLYRNRVMVSRRVN